MLQIFNYLGEVFNGSKTADEQPNPRDMPEFNRQT